MQVSTDSRLKICESIVSTNLDEQIIMVNVDTGYYFGFDKTAKRVLELIKENKTIAEINIKLQSEYVVDPEQCYQEISALIEEMLNEGLLAVCD